MSSRTRAFEIVEHFVSTNKGSRIRYCVAPEPLKWEHTKVGHSVGVHNPFQADFQELSQQIFALSKDTVSYLLIENDPCVLRTPNTLVDSGSFHLGLSH